MNQYFDKAASWLHETGILLRARAAGVYDPYIGMPRYPHVQPSPTTDGTPSLSAAPTQMLKRAGQGTATPPTRQMARDAAPNPPSTSPSPAIPYLDSSGAEVRIRETPLPGAFGAMHAVEGSLLLAAHILPPYSAELAHAAHRKALDLKILGEGTGSRLPIVWPRKLLFDADGRYAGYLLRLPPGRTFHQMAIDPDIPLAARVANGLSLCQAVAAVHGFQDAELLLGDLCLENALFIDRTQTVVFPNAAAMQVSLRLSTGAVGRHLCHGIHVEAPEMHPGGSRVLTRESDAFQLAVLLFWLLVGPGALGMESMRDAVRLDARFGCEPPQLDRHSWRELRHLVGLSCHTLFRRAFTQRGKGLPTVDEWTAVLTHMKDKPRGTPCKAR